MGYQAEKTDQRFTYGDYLKWPDEERWEIIDGIPYNMTPAPSTKHQSLVLELGRQLSTFFLENTCKVFIAPYDIRLPHGDEKDKDIDTVVQPDIVVICDPSKIDPKGCRGVPDLVIEVLSPSTAPKDLKIKLNLYERTGVKEYWIFYPEEKMAMIFKLEQSGLYGRPEMFTEEDSLKTNLFDGLTIDLKLVFRE